MSGSHEPAHEGRGEQRGGSSHRRTTQQTKKKIQTEKEAGHGNEPVDAHLPEVLPNFLGRVFWVSFGQLLHHRVLLGELVNVMLAEPLNAQPCIWEAERTRGRTRERGRGREDGRGGEREEERDRDRDRDRGRERQRQRTSRRHAGRQTGRQISTTRIGT